jgi:hypothetical protein
MRIIASMPVFQRVCESVNGRICIHTELSVYCGHNGFILYAGEQEYFISEKFLTPLIKKGILKRFK